MRADDRIDGLRVEKWLGEQVFRSRLSDGRRVAVRLIESFQIRGRSAEERNGHFYLRIGGWKALTVPGVVELIEGRESAELGCRLVVSRYVQGTDLEELRRANGRPFGPSEVAELLLPAIRLVQRVHEQGMNHGRLRATSLILRRTFSQVDDPFALVDLDCTNRPPPQTGGGSFFHPRQRGTWQANDVYALSAIAWYLTLPNPTVPPLPAHLVLQDTSALGSDWDGFLRRVLAPEPRDRPDDLGTLASELQRFTLSPVRVQGMQAR